ncbi:MAG: transposase [Burkholderiaceae bacterium]|nr:transposase [Burkholderiaceae bacterium]
MARLARLCVPGLPHLVLQRSVHAQPLVHDDADRRALHEALQAAARAQQLAVWGWAVEPQALWLLVCPPAAESLGRAMQMLGRRYVAGFNRRHGRQGALWGGRYRAAVVEPGEWVLTALCMIEQGSSADGAGADPARSRWSSAAHHLGTATDALLTDPPEWWALGNTPFEREHAWRARLQAGPDPAGAAALARAVQGAWVAGSAAFAAEVEARAGRPAKPRRPGRPPRRTATG